MKNKLTAAFNQPAAWRLALAVLVSLTYINTLLAVDFIFDDHYIIVGNPLLRSWTSLPRLLSSGYWQGGIGLGAGITEFRPVLMLSYFLNMQVGGMQPALYHGVNLLIHLGNVLLFLELLRRWYPLRTAGLAAVFFAVLPVHAEAVAAIYGRSELLAGFFILLSWYYLEPVTPRLLPGLGAFALALLTKESALMAPVFLAAQDGLRGGRHIGHKRRTLYLALAAIAAGYLGLRCALLAEPFKSSVDYFAGQSYAIQLLTVSLFVVKHYLFSMITGTSLQIDFRRPALSDAGYGDIGAWFCLIGLVVSVAASVYALGKKRSAGAAWFLTAIAFWLPTSNLILPLDTIGAERFLYMPSLAFCVMLAVWLTSKTFRIGGVIAILLAGWYTAVSVRRNVCWATEMAFYQEALRTNPHSLALQSGLAVSMWRKGRVDEAEQRFLAIHRDHPEFAPALYNLGELNWKKGKWSVAAGYFEQAVKLNPRDPDTLLYLGMAAEKAGRLADAAARYTQALRWQPGHPLAHYSLGRLLLEHGQPGLAIPHLEAYLAALPDDENASLVRRIISEMKMYNPSR